MNKHLIKVKTKCNNYYSFLKKIQYLNLSIYDIEYKDNYVYLKINNEDLTKLKKFRFIFFKKENKTKSYIFNYGYFRINII